MLKRSDSDSSLVRSASASSDETESKWLYTMKRMGSEPDLRQFTSQADVYLDRLPSKSPYVGTFHRGFKASNGGLIQPFDLRPERLYKNCPYIGTFHHGFKASSNDSFVERAMKGNVSCDGSSPRRPPNIQIFMDKIDSSHLPKSPELCGLQAILPRQCGVRILDKIGEGSFGKVVLAINKRNRACWTDPSFLRKLNGMPEEGDSVVLKCVPKQSSYGARGLRYVAREVSIHSKCRHPNISRMYGYYENGQYVTMILGFIDGKELYEVLKIRRQLPEDEACLLTMQVLRGVEYLHRKGIVHRDLTPRNLLVKESGHALVIDLGLAVELADDGGDAQEKGHAGSPVGAVGTTGYIAPEVLRHEKVTRAADVWSVGVVLYEAVFGFPPFAPHEVFSDGVVEFPDPSWGASSDDMQDIVRQMLCKAASRRATASSALAHRWFTPAVTAAADALVAGLEPADAPAGGDSGGGEAEEPPPLCLGAGGVSWSSSSEAEPDPLPPPAAPPLSSHLMSVPSPALHPRAQPAEPGGSYGESPPRLAAGPECEEPGAGRGRGGGKGRCECVLRLDAEIRHPLDERPGPPPADAGATGAAHDGQGEGHVYVARIVKGTAA